MPFFLIIGLALTGLAPDAAAQGVRLACLSRQDMQTAVSSRSVVAPNAAVRAARAGLANAELVRVRLCRRNDEMVYVVTFLRRDGRVAPVTIDASSGKLAADR